MTSSDDTKPMAPNVEPKGYKPPTSAMEVLERYARGERYFVGAQLEGADLVGAELPRANLNEASLHQASLSNAALTEATLVDINARDVCLREADLSNADLSSSFLVAAELQGANLSGAKLKDAYLPRAAILLANLRGADLTNANLQGANLSVADLSAANLQGANLCQSDLGGANLDGTKLVVANLDGACLRGVDLSNTSLLGATVDHKTFSRSAFPKETLKLLLSSHVQSNQMAGIPPWPELLGYKESGFVTLHYRECNFPYTVEHVEEVIEAVVGEPGWVTVTRFQCENGVASFQLNYGYLKDFIAVADQLSAGTWKEETYSYWGTV